MKIVSWNLNSLRARLEHVVKWIEDNDPDVLCLQETKVKNEQFPLEEFTRRGLNVYFHGQPAYNGVALITKHQLTNIKKGFTEGDMNGQARVISADLGDIRIINVYAPQGESEDSPKFEMKEQFFARLRQMLDEEYKTNEKVLLCGDINIAPEAIDVHDADKLLGKCGYHPLEHEWLENLMDWGLTDSFRHHTSEEYVFSWWDYRLNSFTRNKGMRIDLILLSPPLLEQMHDAGIDPTPRGWERPSDHTPIYVNV